jgi:predicted phage terminase large subunit-like protein
MKRPRRVKPEVTEALQEMLQKPVEGEQALEAIREQLREKAKNDLWFLAYHILGYKDIDNDLHHEMCYRWQKRHYKRLTLWMVPRGHLKTTLWTITDAVQEKLRDPDHRHLIVNAKLDNAESILFEIKQHFESNELLRWLFPEYCWDLAPKRKRDMCKVRSDRLDFPCRTKWKKEGNIEIMSVGSSLVSKHFDKFTFDDPTNDKFVENPEVRTSNYNWYMNALQLRDGPYTPIRIIGTRWHFDDMYGRLIRKEEAWRKDFLKNPRGKARMLMYIRRAVEEDVDGNVRAIWPERYTIDDLDEIRDSVGAYIYSCQFDNNPLPSDSAVFKRDDIQNIHPWEIPKTCLNFIGVDLADEDTKKGDFSAIVVISVDHTGKVYVREVIRGKIFPLELIDTLIDLNDRYKPVRIGVETTAFQKSIYKYWQRVATARAIFMPWKEVKRSASKFMRILQLQPIVERREFYLTSGMINYDHLILEMMEYTGKDSAYDDCLDALQAAYECSFEAPGEEVELYKPTSAKVIFDTLFGGDMFDPSTRTRRKGHFIGAA